MDGKTHAKQEERDAIRSILRAPPLRAGEDADDTDGMQNLLENHSGDHQDHHYNIESEVVSIDDSSPPNGTPPSSPPSPYHPNVYLTLWYCFLDGALYSFWGGQLLPIFLFRINEDDRFVGTAFAMVGMMQLLGALCAGCIGDRVARTRVLRVGAFFAVVAVLFLVAGVYWVSATPMLMGQACWGLYVGFVWTSMEALFADSVPTGRRTSIYNTKWIIQTLCYLLGYGGVVVIFFFGGRTWDTSRIQTVMMVGLLIHPLALVPLLRLRDVKQKTEETGQDTGTRSSTVQVVLTSSSSDLHLAHAEEEAAAATLRERSTPDAGAEENRDGSSRRNSQDEADGRANLEAQLRDGECRQAERYRLLELGLNRERLRFEEQQLHRTFCVSRAVARLLFALRITCTSHHAVPYIVCVVDVLMAVGSGMALPYIALFFVDTHQVDAVVLNIIYIASTILTACVSSMARWVAERFTGRLVAVFCIRMVGVTALLCLGLAHPDIPVFGSLPVAIALFLVRNALMNSVMGITRSVVMDCISKDHRAKWSAVESFSSFTWAGSAVLGGFIAATHGRQHVFVVAAVMQICATMLLIPAAIGARPMEAATGE